jgi:hypothetical protein
MASKKTWLLQNTEDGNYFGLGSMDIVYDQGGRLVQLTGIEKLRMLALKCVLTARYIEEGLSYGSTISRLLGQREPSGNELVEGLYLMSVDKALEAFRVAQPNGLDTSEAMARLDGEIQVMRDPSDRTVLLIGAAIRNRDGTVIPIIHSFPTY